MRRAGAWLTKWVGRLAVVAVPFVILSALFAPRLVQPLNRVMCDPKQHLDNHSYVSGGTTSEGANKSLELVCRQGGTTVNVTAKVVAFVGALIIVAFACFSLSSRLAKPRYLVPSDLRQT
jgi:hypothetical protein